MRFALLSILVLALAATAFAASDVAPVQGTPSYGEGTFPIVHQWGIPQDNHCVGLGFDGTYIWVSAGDATTGQCSFYIFDDLGNLMDTRPQGAGASGWGHRDLCFDGTHMFGSFSNVINGFDTASIHQGYFVGAINPNRAEAYDGTYFYVCGFGEYIWRGQWDGFWGSTPGWTILSAGTISGCYGMAYDNVQNCIWMSMADYSGDLGQYDMNGNLLNTYTMLPEFDISGGCEMANTGTFGNVLAVLQQYSPDTVVFYDVGSASAVEEGSWGEIKAMFK
jgi:hypothetical protein